MRRASCRLPLEIASGSLRRARHDLCGKVCRLGAESWIPVGTDHTNSDGRAVNLLPASDYLEPAIYRVHFDAGTYLTKQMAAHGAAPGSTPFYPQAIIDFEVTSETSGQHFHIPLLISPFAYSTYRGS